jgi:serine/threonine protein kinase
VFDGDDDEGHGGDDAHGDDDDDDIVGNDGHDNHHDNYQDEEQDHGRDHDHDNDGGDHGGGDDDDDDEEELNRNISTANYNFRGKVWRPISREAKDLISKLLVVKSSDRISAKKALKHQWFQKDPEIAILARELDNKAEISPRKSPRKRRRTFDDDLQEAPKQQLKINE